jgi:hypothetical protein
MTAIKTHIKRLGFERRIVKKVNAESCLVATSDAAFALDQGIQTGKSYGRGIIAGLGPLRAPAPNDLSTGQKIRSDALRL